MRIWKRLLGTALCLCAAVCLMSVSASAEGKHSHPVCGKTHIAIGDHTGSCNDVTWTALDGTSAIQYDETTKTAYVYLTGKTTLTDTLEVKNGHKLYLCLNGNTLSSTYTVIEVKGGATLNICNCHGGGIITPTESTYAAIEVTPSGSSTATLNLYSGEVSGSVHGFSDNQGIIKLKNPSQNGMAVFNMYGGKVQNRNSNNSCSAVYVTYRSDSQINIYGGEVICDKGYGIGAGRSGDAPILIAGGTITSGNDALHVLGNLTLSGSPKLIHTNDDGADIDITTSDATTPNNYITVTNDFAPIVGTEISVDVPNNQLKTGRIIAKPAAGAASLSDKAKYFVSAEKGYFVESNSNGDLQLTACAITGQPTAGNSYTVTANGSDDKVKYQWYSAKPGEVPVADTTVTNEGNLSYIWEKWLASSIPQNGEVTGFTLTMKKDAVLALLFPDDESIPDRVTINSASISDSTGNHTVHKNGSDFETVTETEWPWQNYKKCTFTAPADGDYTLKISCTADSEYAELQFTATVTADMLGPVLPDQANAALNTSQLETGSYICQVTWENKTTRNSQAVRCAAAPSHAHSWSSKWTSDDTHHWHECEDKNCPVTENSEKKDYNAHAWDEGKITTAATCTAAGEKTYTCSNCGRTKTEQIDALNHDWGEWAVTTPATTSAAGEETRTCKRDASHMETRAIPKLTPAPSGGGSSSGSSSTPAVTVPVSGSGDTVHVSASVSGSTAEVKEIKSAELDKIGTDSAVVIDLSGLNKGVTGVTLSTDTIDSICKAEADGVTIKLPNAELRVDRQTLAAVTEQAAGSKIRLVVEPDGTARSTMTAAQKSTLDGMRNAAVLEAYFVSDGTRIHDFKGGSVELSIPYRASGALRAWFLKEDGTREPVSARYDKENAQLILHHFSHYVIEELDSSAAYTVCAKDDSCPIWLFADAAPTAWYHDGVHYCIENGLMQGVSTASFLPNGSTTRAQLVTILWRLEGNPDVTEAVSFSDAADGAWYAGAVRWTAGSGVVKGYDNGSFGPDDAVTREQMVTILYRYAQYKGYDVSIGEDTNILSFDDAFAVSEYAIPAMQWACGSGLMTGAQRDDGMALAPRDTATRAQTATLLTRFQSAFAKEP